MFKMLKSVLKMPYQSPKLQCSKISKNRNKNDLLKKHI